MQVGSEAKKSVIDFCPSHFMQELFYENYLISTLKDYRQQKERTENGYLDSSGLV
jgi:hypothetical protein